MNIINKIDKYITESKRMTLQSTVKRRINQQLHKIGTDYYKAIPLNMIFNILKSYNIIVLQEDNTEWSGMLVGNNEQVYFDLGNAQTKNEKNQYIPYTNAMLALSYYKMSSGRYEIVSYIT